MKAVASRHTATRLSRTEVSPASPVSLVCGSVQGAQPLIWLARIFSNAYVAAGRLESVTAWPAELRYFPKLAAMAVPG